MPIPHFKENMPSSTCQGITANLTKSPYKNEMAEKASLSVINRKLKATLLLNGTNALLILNEFTKVAIVIL